MAWYNPASWFRTKKTREREALQHIERIILAEGSELKELLDLIRNMERNIDNTSEKLRLYALFEKKLYLHKRSEAILDAIDRGMLKRTFFKSLKRRGR